MALSAHLRRLYRRSHYHVAGLDLCIGRRSGGLDGVLAGLGVRDAVLITAWNPASRLRPRQWNERKMAALRRRLGDTPALPASGAWHGWCEEHLLVAGDPRRLAVLARQFGQSAIVGARRGQGLRLTSLV
jgi:hypothetical protein